ncbi:hypothetical protein [Actinoplanes sp. CA-252034]|uniref:hypothetical protein n=1 Tax=Actinoplanes sp. CA-252034 TaxID=3239906 RepID=UPI003D97C75E
MSFRIRVFALMALVALGATGATVALTWWQARDQVSEAASASRETTELIQRELREQAVRNGTWEGVDTSLRRLREMTGQRLRLVDPYGQVIADTDHLDRRTARPPGSVAVFVDPLPELIVPDHGDGRAATIAAIDIYRTETLRAACLYRHGYELVVTPGLDGVPRHGVAGGAGAIERCRPAGPAPWQRADDLARVRQCGPLQADCLRAAFRRQIATGKVAPAPLLLTIGAGNEPVRTLDAGPVLLITLVVAALSTGGPCWSAAGCCARSAR